MRSIKNMYDRTWGLPCLVVAATYIVWYCCCVTPQSAVSRRMCNDGRYLQQVCILVPTIHRRRAEWSSRPSKPEPNNPLLSSSVTPYLRIYYSKCCTTCMILLQCCCCIIMMNEWMNVHYYYVLIRYILVKLTLLLYCDACRRSYQMTTLEKYINATRTVIIFNILRTRQGPKSSRNNAAMNIWIVADDGRTAIYQRTI